MLEIGGTDDRIRAVGRRKTPNRRWRACLLMIGASGLLLATVTTWFSPAAHGTPAITAQEKLPVKVLTRKEGDITHFLVQNDALCEVTMTFEVSAMNLKADRALPCTETFLPGRVTKAFSLTPVSTASQWEYHYTNYYKLGSNCAQHEDNVRYLLPFRPGHKYSVSQGYNGKFSHTGPNQYSIDWQMPEGTPVCAARDGVVVGLKDDSDTGGPGMEFDPYNNYVSIRHADGTIGHYCHLQKGGCTVKLGQTIKAGDCIARSGNTGFSSGPHLHFSVYRTKNGRERESLPVKFATSEATSVTLVEGHSYRAPRSLGNATAAQTPPKGQKPRV